MPSTKLSGSPHQSLFASAHFSVALPLTTSRPNRAQASLGSTCFFLPLVSAWMRATMALRSLTCFWTSAQLLACADARDVEAKSMAGNASATAPRKASFSPKLGVDKDDTGLILRSEITLPEFR